jgi:transcriptional regulator with XRE-family HTH domain
MNIKTSLSNALRECKRLSGLTYDELVEGTGCSKTSIRYALNGGDNVSIEVMQKILDYTGQTVEISVVYSNDFI